MIVYLAPLSLSRYFAIIHLNWQLNLYKLSNATLLHSRYGTKFQLKLRNTPKNSFKNKIKSLLLENLKTNGYYPELIKLFNS